jgi:release factor glutamine methyltransferase
MKQAVLYQTLRAQLAAQAQFLPDKPEETPDSTLHALWHLASGTALSAELALQYPLSELDAAAQTALQALLQQRIAGIPLPHLTGRQQFLGMEMLAGSQALVPRKETQLLARVALELSKQSNTAPLMLLDVCTGSGNIALALAMAQASSAAQVLASDLSADALELARRNAAHMGLAGRVEFRAGDLLAPFDEPRFHGSVDVLTCNPPYISSARVEQLPEQIGGHEPHLAFDGGPFGVAILMRLLQDAPRFLRKGGWLAFELGLGQGPGLLKRLKLNPHFDTVHAHADEAGDIRVISARRA